ncbi:unnamed protein product [Clonostachys byssicola]|uniref:Uncharacterized protein n=1 Tax=Clonostachys byssicola TaxID=160290 RepID=A0A9N9U5H6_9HYPO|nr:unnamed protein product [Clonostachys byssicola]
MSNWSAQGYMKAVQWEGKLGQMSTNIVPVPKITKPEDAIVRITSSAICGTDLHIYHGLVGTKNIPWGVGHEAVGIVEEVGPAVDFFKRGDRVLILCMAEDGNFLPKPSMSFVSSEGPVAFGLGLEMGSDKGLQTEYACIPWADSSLVKIPCSLDDREWLPLTDAFPTGWSALSRSGFEAGDTVAVFGAGGIGLMCAYSAILRGASLVYVIDHVPSRLAKAASIGAMPINFTRGGKASEQILALRPQGVKRTVDCVGETCVNEDLQLQQDYILREATAITTLNGGIGIAGAYMLSLVNGGEGTEASKKLGIKPEISFPIEQAWFKSLRIQGGMLDLKNSVPALVELVKNGAARPGFIFSNEYSLEDAPLAYQRFEQREESKVLLKGKRK